ncbi:MAG: ATP-dependent DNA ligase [Candidatus Diapherotrites archaeon]|nr:ATP-dependent DNA ligase [Candidatus Diapherotrites archaeon]
MDFARLAELFDSLEKVSSRLEMTELLVGAFKEAPADSVRAMVYLLEGKLAPDFEGIDLGLGENLVMDAFALATGYSEEEVVARFKKSGDLGLVIEGLMNARKQRSLFSEKFSLNHVHELLERVASAKGHGSQEVKLRTLAELLNSSTPLESKFISRIVLGSTRLGVGDPTILDALAVLYSDEFARAHPQEMHEMESGLKEKKEEKRAEERSLRLKQLLRSRIEEKFNLHPDLGFLALTLRQKGLKGLEGISLVPGIPFRPTLAERLPSSQEILEKLGPCAVEAKYDGLRLAVHKDGGRVWIFSRRMEDMTDMFPEIVEGVRSQVKASRVILEGEALAFNEAEQKFYPFQVTIQRKRKYGVGEKAKEFPLTLYAFDVVLIESENLMGLPFSERRQRLESLIGSGERLKPSEFIVAHSPVELDVFFDFCIQEGLEGIIAKDLNAPYIAGARKFAWVKLKKSYKSGLNDSVDVVIVGYDKGKGKRTQFGVGALLTAVYDEENGSFKSVAKIGTGLSEEQLAELEQLLSASMLPHKPFNVESGMDADVWVEPKYVIEVVADEITRSPVHAAGASAEGGLALRFPRMVSFRRDKDAADATTETELLKLFERQRGKNA